MVEFDRTFFLVAVCSAWPDVVQRGGESGTYLDFASSTRVARQLRTFRLFPRRRRAGRHHQGRGWRIGIVGETEWVDVLHDGHRVLGIHIGPEKGRRRLQGVASGRTKKPCRRSPAVHGRVDGRGRMGREGRW